MGDKNPKSKEKNQKKKDTNKADAAKKAKANTDAKSANRPKK